MRIWFDQSMPMPSSFDVSCATARSALTLLRTGGVTDMSIAYDEATGGTEVLALAMVVESMAASGALPRLGWTIHDPAPERLAAMVRALELADEHWSQAEQSSEVWAVTASGRLVALQRER